MKCHKWSDTFLAQTRGAWGQDGQNSVVFGNIETGLSVSGYYNLSILRLVDLSEGVKIKIPGVATQAFVEEWLKAVKFIANNIDKLVNKKFKYRLETSIVEISID